MEKHNLIRKIYLYFFSFLGLVLLTIGGIRFLDMGLKTFIFTRADEPQKIRQEYSNYSMPPISVARIGKYQDEDGTSEDEKAMIKEWLDGYERWKETGAKIDYVVSQRHKDASGNLALILIGLPLYIFHWRAIKREIKNKKNNQDQ